MLLDVDALQLALNSEHCLKKRRSNSSHHILRNSKKAKLHGTRSNNIGPHGDSSQDEEDEDEVQGHCPAGNLPFANRRANL